MHICAKHGKRRQQAFLDQFHDTGEWVCKPPDECKLCTNIGNGRHPGEKNKCADGRDDPVRSPAAEGPLKSHTSTTEDASQSSHPNPKDDEFSSVARASSDVIITSWADEVDREFPFPDNEVPSITATPRKDSPSSKASPKDRVHKNRRMSHSERGDVSGGAGSLPGR